MATTARTLFFTTSMTFFMIPKRNFSRIPFHADFWRWADWGEKLMSLYIGYASVEP